MKAMNTWKIEQYAALRETLAECREALQLARAHAEAGRLGSETTKNFALDQIKSEIADFLARLDA